MYLTPDVFPLTSIVNKSCKIECCVNSMFPINQNMIDHFFIDSIHIVNTTLNVARLIYYRNHRENTRGVE